MNGFLHLGIWFNPFATRLFGIELSVTSPTTSGYSIPHSRTQHWLTMV